jgi:hypothetical protein
LLPAYTTALQEGSKVFAGNQEGTFGVTEGKPVFNPRPHGIFVYPEPFCSFFYGVAAMDLDSAMIRSMSSHEYQPYLWLWPAVLRDDSNFWTKSRISWSDFPAMRAAFSAATSLAGQPTARPPRLTGLGNTPSAMRK